MHGSGRDEIGRRDCMTTAESDVEEECFFYFFEERSNGLLADHLCVEGEWKGKSLKRY